MTSGEVAPRPYADIFRGKTALVVALALFTGAAAPMVLDVAASLGANVPQSDVRSDYVVAWAWAFVLGVTIAFWPIRKRDKLPLLGLWLVKCGVALGFMLVYEGAYGSLDAFSYFRSVGVDLVTWDTTGGTHRIVQIARMHPPVLRESYHALKISFSFLGLIAVYLFYCSAVIAMDRERQWLLLLLGCMPSILFWSTILGKDPVVLLGVALYTYGAVNWARNPRALWLLATVAGVVVAASIRLWLGPILVIPFLLLIVHAGHLSRAMRAGILVAGAIAAIVLLVSFSRLFKLAALSDLLAAAGAMSGTFSTGGSSQRIPFDIGTLGGLIAFVPLGAFTALFRPLPFDAHNAFAMLAAAENTVLLGLLGVALARMKRFKFSDPLIPWSIVLLLLWSALYSIVSYQNLGAAVRFKAQILPLLVLLLIRLACKEEQEKPGESDAG